MQGAIWRSIYSIFYIVIHKKYVENKVYHVKEHDFLSWGDKRGVAVKNILNVNYTPVKIGFVIFYIVDYNDSLINTKLHIS